jgi:hypothetical protein
MYISKLLVNTLKAVQQSDFKYFGLENIHLWQKGKITLKTAAYLLITKINILLNSEQSIKNSISHKKYSTLKNKFHRFNLFKQNDRETQSSQLTSLTPTRVMNRAISLKT